jgi:hypothetical protein
MPKSNVTSAGILVPSTARTFRIENVPIVGNKQKTVLTAISTSKEMGYIFVVAHASSTPARQLTTAMNWKT